MKPLSAIALALALAAGAGPRLAEAAALPPGPAQATRPGGVLAPGSVPRAVTVARTTLIPDCTLHVDAASPGGPGTAAAPFATIGAAVEAAEPDAVICVAEGTYPEQLSPGAKPLTLAGGFQRGTGFSVRDSAAYPSHAAGDGTGSFLRIDDPGPEGDQLTAIDGFEISGYAQAVVRSFYIAQRFDLTNNFIHDNVCTDPAAIGGGFFLANIVGTIAGNVFRDNRCSRGGAGALDDGLNGNQVVVANNLVEGNAGTEEQVAHGGALYLFGNQLAITGNLFTDNSVTGWGAGLYVGSYNGGGQQTNATLSWNVYRDNSAGIAGGGFFCDDAAACVSDHEVFFRNCGGNILLDGGSQGDGPTTARFDHLTNVGALDVGCEAPGPGVRIDKGNDAPDAYTFTNAIFWGNAPDADFAPSCETACDALSISVSHSAVQTDFADLGAGITFGEGILAPADPLFVDPAGGDFHLLSAAGHWTPGGYQPDGRSSPFLAAGDPAAATDANPDRAGPRIELGAFGNSIEASFTR